MIDKREQLKDSLTLYFIMGSTNCMKDPVYVLEQAIEGGITLFQFREKGLGALEGQEKMKLAKKLQKVCKDAGIPFIVNDDVELALAIDADGIHIGQEDERASIVRDKIGDKWLGVSTHTLAEAQQAIDDGADYLGLGSIYPTLSKDDIVKIHGLDIIKSFRINDISIPIVGIGGISSMNAKEVIEAGADGISVISAISGAENIREAARELKRAVRSAR
ncbi:thiamine phosphate synthase [Rossellomorea aquimaris]|uniref:Thiamine-phosphate synthase n=1 Tax=Rossellomorea aquimaris TaxID=189382 RepID=A0A366EET1_9BACI|nr:thiamine phosphate synthase [Rossellomorea aquimaris]RBP00917.1 thiamine-phosphate diphosphorylase [Rossellomorea aquimaris]